MLIDPLSITITNGSSSNDGSSIGEQWIESYLDANGSTLTILANGGDDAGITVEDLADNELNGNISGDANGGSLTLRASGGGNPTIKFNDVNDTIKVVGNLTLEVDDGEGGHEVGSITVGKLQAGRVIDLKAGSISTGDLVIDKTINTSTDTSYSIAAQAYSGDLTVKGDVRIDVSNSAAAAVATDVNLKATGKVSVSGNISSKAAGKGYYHYNWATADGDATTYYGQQPWTLQNEGDHRITANLNVQAGGNYSAASIDVNAIDNHTEFATNGVGGYWQTATPTQHNFWRATAAQATAAVDAGGNATVAGNATVRADGYATSDYSEEESYGTMVDNHNYTSGSQTVQHWGNVTSDGQTQYQVTGTTTTTYNDLKGSLKGGGERYIWSFGPYRVINGGTVNHSANTSTYTDTSAGSHDTSMSYSGVGGLKASLDIDAGGSVTLNGLDVNANNRSTTGTGDYTDTNWGYQDTVGAGNNTSAAQEVNYYDGFDTEFTAATSSAQVNITAGDNQSVTLNGGNASYDVIASHSNLTASENTLASASMTITAGVAGGASGSGQVTLNGPIHVEGDDDASIKLTVLNHDGGIVQADGDAAILVKNNYTGHDANASFTSNTGNISLDEVAVNAGRNAYLNVTADQNLTLTGAASATAREEAEANLIATHGTLVTDGTITATANQGMAIAKLAGAGNVDTNAGISASGSTQATVQIDSSATLTIDAAISANASSGSGGSADIMLTGADGVTSNAALTATATAMTTSGFYPNITVNGGMASVNIGSAGGDVTLNDNVTANAYKNASIAVDANGGNLTVAADKSVAATATGAAFGFGYNYSYAANVDVAGATGMTLDGSVTATAANGSASVDVLTDGGSSAGISQGADSVVKADGQSASLTVKAGNATPNAANAAAITMAGDMQARGTTGTATLQVAGKSASVNNFSAISTGNAASATVTTLDGALTADGTGTVSGNANNATGASLTMSANGALDLQDATLSATNSNTGASAGAQATLSSTGGVATLGAASVAGYNTALLTGSASGNLSSTSALSATAITASGTARIDLASTTGSLTLDAASALNATANASNGIADINLTGATGMTLNGDATATASNGTATVDMLTNGGSSAAVTQGVDSVVKADGRTAGLVLNAGHATPDASNAAAITLGGDLQARGTTGAATLDIAGKSGSVTNFSAISTGNAAGATITTLDGALTANGSGTVSGYADSSTGANLAMTSSGALDTRTATLTATNTNTGSHAGAKATLTANDGINQLGAVSVNGYNAALLNASASSDLSATDALSATASAASGTARIDLASTTGSLTLDAESALNATANASNGVADLNLTSATGMTLNGDVTAAASNGTATVDMLTNGGSSAGITQGTDSVVKADGQTAGVTLMAGNATPDASNAAAVALSGDLQAHGTTGTASIDVAGDSLTVSGDVEALTLDAGSAEVNLFAIKGMTVEGKVAAQADNGDAAVRLSTAGGNAAAIVQDTESTIAAVGQFATVEILAGGDYPDMVMTIADLVTPDASFNLAGKVMATGDESASINIAGASGTINEFEAVSDNGTARADVVAHDGALNFAGTGSVRGADSAILMGRASGDVDVAGALSVQVGADEPTFSILGVVDEDQIAGLGLVAGGTVKLDGEATLRADADHGNSAEIILLAGEGIEVDGDIEVSAENGEQASLVMVAGVQPPADVVFGNGSLFEGGLGDFDEAETVAAHITINGDLTAAAAGRAEIGIVAVGLNSAEIEQGSDSEVTAMGSEAVIQTMAGSGIDSGQDLLPQSGESVAHITIDGQLNAVASGDMMDGGAGIILMAMGQTDATIKQGEGSGILAAGDQALLQISAQGGMGGMSISADAPTSAGSITLDGTLQALAGSGSSIEILGGAVSVRDFTATAEYGDAEANIIAATGDMTLGQGLVQGAESASLTAVSNGDMLVNGDLTAEASGMIGLAFTTMDADPAGASINLYSENGAVTVAAADDAEPPTVAALGFGQATVGITAATGVTLDGDLIASTSDIGSAAVLVATTGGSTATITQEAGRTMRAEGGDAVVMVNAGSGMGGAGLSFAPVVEAAAVSFGGSLEAAGAYGAGVIVEGASGTVNTFSAVAEEGSAGATIVASEGNLTLAGNGTVQASETAELAVMAAGSLQVNGELRAEVKEQGGEDQTLFSFMLPVESLASIELESATGTIKVAADAALVASGAGSANAEIVVGAATGIVLNGDVAATSVNGDAGILLQTGHGNAAAITQGSASSVTAEGQHARIDVQAGAGFPNHVMGFADIEAPDAVFNMGGTLTAVAGEGATIIDVAGASGTVNNFSATSAGGDASVDIVAESGSLKLTGNGKVAAPGGSGVLELHAHTGLDTRNANLQVSGSDMASALLVAKNGGAQLGAISVANAGQGTATLAASSFDAMSLTGNLLASAVGAGEGGEALVQIATIGGEAASSITQSAGTSIRAATSGEAGNAGVDIQAGTCCNATVSLNGTVEAAVNGHGGDGNASVAVRGSEIFANNVKANVQTGTGSALIDLTAPKTVTVAGVLDAQAIDATARADIKLIADKLVYTGGKAVLSQGNSHVQLAPFDTRRMIGVDSDRDFDANVETNYALATLQKFVGKGAEIRFGGEVDRSAWTTGTPAVACVPGMDDWTSKLQQTADIHVAGNGRLDLGDVKMVFDTTGTTYYHDMQMSPWSVPAGRLAVFVARPNIDRYLDRTENTLQTMTKMVENAPGTPVTTGPAPLGSTPIEGNLFMAGDGVNTGTQLAAAGGVDAGTGVGTGTDAGTASDGAGDPSSNASEQSDSEDDAKEREERERRRTSQL
jgi:hypothetical protein